VTIVHYIPNRSFISLQPLVALDN